MRDRWFMAAMLVERDCQLSYRSLHALNINLEPWNQYLDRVRKALDAWQAMERAFDFMLAAAEEMHTLADRAKDERDDWHQCLDEINARCTPCERMPVPEVSLFPVLPALADAAKREVDGYLRQHVAYDGMRADYEALAARMQTIINRLKRVLTGIN